MTNPYAVYAKQMDNVETKEELLIKVYEEILSLLNISIYAIEEGDIKTKAENLTKVSDAILVLKASLDLEKGGEVARNLDEIYSFVIEKLVEANLKNDVKLIKDIIEILTPIYEGFKEVKEKIK